MLVMSLNKVLSLFKLLGIAFFAPAFIASYLFLIPKEITPDSILTLSEFCLSVGVLTTFIKPNDERSYKAKAGIMFAIPVLFGICLSYFKGGALLMLSQTAQTAATAAVVLGTLVLIRSHGYNEIKLMTSLILWEASIMLRLFDTQMYAVEIIIMLKLASYMSFFYYFYTTIYNSFMHKIVESEKLKRPLS
jgi:hypothetical protein